MPFQRHYNSQLTALLFTVLKKKKNQPGNFRYLQNDALYDIQALCFTVELMQISEDKRAFGQTLTSAGHCASETRVP